VTSHVISMSDDLYCVEVKDYRAKYNTPRRLYTDNKHIDFPDQFELPFCRVVDRNPEYEVLMYTIA